MMRISTLKQKNDELKVLELLLEKSSVDQKPIYLSTEAEMIVPTLFYT